MQKKQIDAKDTKGDAKRCQSKCTERFLFLFSTLEIGGSEKKTVRIANYLHGMGYNVHVAYLNGPEPLLKELAPDLPIVCLSCLSVR